MTINIGDLVPNQDTRTYKLDDTNQLLNEGKIGIEIEAEGLSDSVIRTVSRCGLWRTVQDSSLRNGIEFTSLPILGMDIIEAIEFIDKTISTKARFGERTSTHIHVNIQDITPEALFQFMKLYVIFERAMFEYVGNDRDKCIYCNPIYNSKNSQEYMFSVTSSKVGTSAKNHISKWSKYHAMNIGAILKFGTVEFRHLYGTANKQVLLDWINILLSLKRYSINNPDMDLINRISAVGVSRFVDEVLMENKGEPLVKYCKESYIYQGVRVLQDIVNVDVFDRATNSRYGCCVEKSMSVKIKNKSAAKVWENTKATLKDNA